MATSTKKADPKEKAAPTPDGNEEPIQRMPFDFFDTPDSRALLARLIAIGTKQLDAYEGRMADEAKMEAEYGSYDGVDDIGYPFNKITHVIYSGGEVKPDPISLQSINGFIVFRENGKQVILPLHRVIRLEEREPEQPAEAAAPGEEII